MAILGLFGLLVALLACAVSLGCLAAGHLLAGRKPDRARTLCFVARVCTVLCFAALTLSVGVLAYCFLTGDVTLDYVVRNRSRAQGEGAWAFRLSGLWAGRAGSLLLWAWLIALLDAAVVAATARRAKPLDNGALAAAQLVLLVFLALLALTPGNMPFTLLDVRYTDGYGGLIPEAEVLGMSSLLEHWAMVAHAPLLLAGNAALTLPFAYAVAALIVGDGTTAWVRRATPFLMAGWLLLVAGVGLGALWAYVVVGWGGYWGWDAVENGGLLPLLAALALIHGFGAYRQRSAMKRACLVDACLAFSLVMLGAFLARSGAVPSVHGLGENGASLVAFGLLAIAPLLAALVGVPVRWRAFAAAGPKEGPAAMARWSAALAWANQGLLWAFMAVIAFMTLAPVLPGWLPGGGQALPASAFQAVALPFGVAYVAVAALCALVRSKACTGRRFRELAIAPLICAAVGFAVLLALFILVMLPNLQAQAAASGDGGAAAIQGILALAGLAAACALLFLAAFGLVRGLRGRRPGARGALASIGGALSHCAMAVLLVGLIGSSTCMVQASASVPYDSLEGESSWFQAGPYRFQYQGTELVHGEGEDVQWVYLDVYRQGAGDEPLASVAPAMQVVRGTGQQKAVPGVAALPLGEVMAVYHGAEPDGTLGITVQGRPLMGLVWAAFALLLLGSLASLAGSPGAAVRHGAAKERPAAKPRRGKEPPVVAAEPEAALAEEPLAEAAPAVAPLAETALEPGSEPPSQPAAEPREEPPVELPAGAPAMAPDAASLPAMPEAAVVSGAAAPVPAVGAQGPAGAAVAASIEVAEEPVVASMAQASGPPAGAMEPVPGAVDALEDADPLDEAIAAFWSRQPGVLFGSEAQSNASKRKQGNGSSGADAPRR